MIPNFTGTGVAIVTPFLSSGKIDYNSLNKLLNCIVDNEIDFVVGLGTTSEAVTLTSDEKKEVMKYVIEVVNNRVPIVMGIGGNNTAAVVNEIKNTNFKGVAGILSVAPYYNKPTQEGLYQHYKAINDNCGIPIIIYNIPSRSVIDMTVDTMSRLFELKNIVGVKDATGNLDRVTLQKEKMGNEFIQLTGEDGNVLEFNKKGGVGCISVTANIAPKLCSNFQNFSKSKNSNEIKEAERINDLLQPVHKALFVESNPSPVKYAAKLLNLCDDDVRLPLVKVMDSTKESIKKALVSAKLI